MDEILSRFPAIAEDIFESLDDESLVHCKEAIRSISSFMEEGTKFWKRIIRKYLDNKNFLCSHFKESWEILMDKKKTRPEIIKELGRAVQHYLNRHGGKCFEASLYEGRKETCSHREPLKLVIPCFVSTFSRGLRIKIQSWYGGEWTLNLMESGPHFLQLLDMAI